MGKETKKRDKREDLYDGMPDLHIQTERTEKGFLYYLYIMINGNTYRTRISHKLTDALTIEGIPIGS